LAADRAHRFCHPDCRAPRLTFVTGSGLGRIRSPPGSHGLADEDWVTPWADGELTRPGEIIHACENPQVLQRLAAAGVERPVACMSGNPAVAGMALLRRTVVRYHGDFDWPGIAIARRIFDHGARPWRFGRDDYIDAVDRLPVDSRLGLSGRVEATPRDEKLGAAMTATHVAVHEEAIVNLLLADIGSG
jgi:uncharacterized protein (TIGR02679 family)